MRDNTLYTLLLLVSTVIITALLTVIYVQDRKLSHYRDNTETKTTTDTVYRTMVLTDTVTSLVRERTTKTDTVYIAGDTLPHSLELKERTYTNTLQDDGDTLTYRAHVSGYDLDGSGYPRLDSIGIALQRKEIHTTTTEVVREKAPRWHLSPSVGIGYGIAGGRCDVYLGVSLGYDIWRK